MALGVTVLSEVSQKVKTIYIYIYPTAHLSVKYKQPKKYSRKAQDQILDLAKNLLVTRENMGNGGGIRERAKDKGIGRLVEEKQCRPKVI